MAKPVLITADSTADLSPELIERYDIRIIPLTVFLGEREYKDGIDLTPEDIFASYHRDGSLPKTAAPSVGNYLDLFAPLVEAGYEVVHLSISSEISGSYQNSVLAAEELVGVFSVDTRALCTGIGLLVIDAAECRDRGMAAEEIAEREAALTGKVSTSFVLDTLEFLWKGGRCSGITALGANLLQIRPALEMRDGKIEICKKYRGSPEHVRRKYISERLEGRKIRPGHVFLSYSGEISSEELDALEESVRSLSGADEVHRTRAGSTICSHCGPGTIAVIFLEE